MLTPTILRSMRLWWHHHGPEVQRRMKEIVQFGYRKD